MLPMTVISVKPEPELVYSTVPKCPSLSFKANIWMCVCMNNNLNRSIIFHCSSSHNKNFGIMVRWWCSFLCKGKEGATVPQINESRNSVCYPTLFLLKQDCFDWFLSAATFWWCVSHGGSEFLWIENVPIVWQVLACFGLITIFNTDTEFTLQ